MAKDRLINSLAKFLDEPEIKVIPWVNCLRAAQRKYGFSEEWFVKELQKAEIDSKR